MRKILITASLLCMLCVGCNHPIEIREVRNIEPQMFNGQQSAYFYVIDKKTNIVYIQFYVGQQGGITVAYNEDGTVMTKRDLYKLFKEKFNNDEDIE